jgi:hypothetical protein
MKKNVYIKRSFIILFALIIFVISSTADGSVWASSLFQTVPTLTPSTEGEPAEEPGDEGGESTFFGENLRENLGLIIGCGFCILIGGGLLGGLIAWWIVRGGDDDEEDDDDDNVEIEGDLQE